MLMGEREREKDLMRRENTRERQREEMVETRLRSMHV